jgi:hypothetical protein
VNDPRIHTVTGTTEAEYDRMLAEGPVSGAAEPRMHRHPILGIWHAHGPTVEAARTPHTHRPIIDWDTTPIPVAPIVPEQLRHQLPDGYDIFRIIPVPRRADG